MPRYHFDLIDTTTIADQGGSEVHDDLKAMDVAEELARRLVTDRPDLKERNYSILVSNEDGEEVARVRLGSSVTAGCKLGAFVSLEYNGPASLTRLGTPHIP